MMQSLLQSKIGAVHFSYGMVSIVFGLVSLFNLDATLLLAVLAILAAVLGLLQKEMVHSILGIILAVYALYTSGSLNM